MRIVLQALAFTAVLIATTADAASIRREVPLQVQTIGNRLLPIPLGVSPKGIAYDGLQMWVANYDGNTVTRIDAVLNEVKQTISTAVNPTSAVYDGTYVWIFCQDGKGYRYNSSGVQQSGTVTLSGSPWGAVFDGHYIWVATARNVGGHYGAVDKIDIVTRAVVTYTTDVNSNGSVGFDGSNIWVGYSGLAKFDVQTGVRTFYDPSFAGGQVIGGAVNSWAFDGTHIWTRAGEDLIKIDPATNAIVATVVGIPDPRNYAFDGTYLWVASHGSDSVVRIDVRTNQIVDSLNIRPALIHDLINLLALYRIVPGGEQGLQSSNPSQFVD